MIFMFIGFGAYNDREWLGLQGGEERKGRRENLKPGLSTEKAQTCEEPE